MKKTRNSFFAENSFQSYNPVPMNGAPYQAASNYFYEGPLPNNMPNSMPNNYNTNSGTYDIETRLSKIERQINRLDYRISKLEGASSVLSTDNFDNNNSNMYML